MPDFMVLKKTRDTGTAADWTPVTIIHSADDAAHAVTQGYMGDGRYAALEWTEESEFNSTTPPPEVEAAEPPAEEPPDE